MDAEQIRQYALSKKAVSEGFPFDQTTLVFKVGGKMFLLLSLDRFPLGFSVKTDPNWSDELRASYPQIQGAFHMNKTHWNSVEPDGLERKLVLQLIDHSYDLVFASLTRKLREEILEGE